MTDSQPKNKMRQELTIPVIHLAGSCHCILQLLTHFWTVVHGPGQQIYCGLSSTHEQWKSGLPEAHIQQLEEEWCEGFS